jgi:hypothetical protein
MTPSRPACTSDAAPIQREAMHRISDIDSGFAPREQAALEDAPPVTAEGTFTLFEWFCLVVGLSALIGAALVPVLMEATK